MVQSDVWAEYQNPHPSIYLRAKMYLLGERPADAAHQQGHSRPAHKGQAGPGASGQRRNGQASPVYCTSEDGQAIKDILSVGMTH